jgi:hypothetical protein
MAGATTDLPEKLDPDAGISLRYFTGPDGFAKRMDVRTWPGGPPKMKLMVFRGRVVREIIASGARGPYRATDFPDPLGAEHKRHAAGPGPSTAHA